jgi:hypothetical protein
VAARIVRIARRHPDQTLALLGVVAAACGIFAAAGQDRLELGSGNGAASRLQVVVRGAPPVGSPAFRVPLGVMTTALRSDPAVASVRRNVAPDRHSATLVVLLSGSPSERTGAVDRIETGLDPGPLTISFSGEAGTLQADRDQAFHDLPLLLAAALPAAALAILLLGPGGALGALFSLAATVFASAAACVALAGTLDLSVLALVGAACGGVPASLLSAGLVAHGPASRRLILAAGAGAVAFAAVALGGPGGDLGLALSGGLAWLFAVPAALLALTAAGELWEHPSTAGRWPPAWAPAPPRRSLIRLLLSGLAAAAGAALAAAAALGLCHLVFGDGRLGFTAGALPDGAVLAVAATVAACSLAASGAEAAATAGAAGARGAALLAEGVTVLCAAALVFSGLRPMQLAGFGIAAGLALDLLVIRWLRPAALARVRAR